MFIVDGDVDIPTTNAEEFALEVEDVSPTIAKVSGQLILSHWCSLLTRSNHCFIGFSMQKNILERICATTPGKSIPLWFPEGTLFPSIFYKMVEDDGSIAGSIAMFLVNGEQVSHGFASIENQIWSCLISVSSAKSSNPSYISCCYDIVTNLKLNYQDSRIALNRGLALNDNLKRKIGITCKNYSPLFQSVDST